jgi:hypothetical protein
MTMATLEKIYKELKALRREVEIFIPRESLSDYTHPKKIVAAYKRASRRYPNRPASRANSKD